MNNFYYRHRKRLKYNPLEKLSLFYYDNGDGHEGEDNTDGGMNDGTDSNGTGDGIGNNDNSYGGGGSEYGGRDYGVPDKKTSPIGPATEETINLEQSVNPFGKGTTQKDGTTTYGLDTFNGVTTEESYLGGLVSIDTHHHLNGKEFSTADEMSADALEMFGLEVNKNNINTVEDITIAVVAVVLGAPAITIGLKSAKAAVSLGVATGTIAPETADKMNFAISIVDFAYSAYGFVEQTSMLADMSGYMTSTGKLAAVAVTAIGLYGLSNQFNDLIGRASALGIDISGIGLADVSGFDSYHAGNGGLLGERGGSVMGALEEVVRWKALNRVNMGSVGTQITSTDIFDKMAGGVLFNAFMGGGMFFTAIGQQEQLLASVGQSTKFDDDSKQFVTGSDYWFNKNINVAKDDIDSGSAKDNIYYAKRMNYNNMVEANNIISGKIDEYNTELSAYNSEVNTWNSHPSGYNYDAAQARLDAKAASMSALSAEIDNLSSAFNTEYN